MNEDLKAAPHRSTFFREFLQFAESLFCVKLQKRIK